MPNLTREQILEQRKRYYNFSPVLYEIVKCLNGRELTFLSQKGEEKLKPVRFLIAHNVEYLKKHFKWINFEKSLLNIYHSVAFLKPNIPVFSYNLKERTHKEDYLLFNKEYEKYVLAYNLFIDIDGKEDWDLAYEEAIKLKQVLEEYDLPFYCINSSEKGIHFCIESKYMPKMEINALLELLNNVIYNLKGIYELSSLDNSITDLKRICKVPYSCVGNVVCLPLDDKMFNEYSPEMVTIPNVLKNVRIINRGLCVRNLELGEEKLKKNVLNFLEDFK